MRALSITLGVGRREPSVNPRMDLSYFCPSLTAFIAFYAFLAIVESVSCVFAIASVSIFVLVFVLGYGEALDMDVPLISIIVRGTSEDCKQKGDRFFKRCECKKWLEYFHNGKQHRVAAKTRSWAIAEEVKRTSGGAVQERRLCAEDC